MMKLMKQLFCKHKYLVEDMSDPIVTKVTCIHCGKTKGVLRQDFFSKRKLEIKLKY